MATDPVRVVSSDALWRITDRRAFARLRRYGQRATRHGVSVTWVAPAPETPAGPPRAAFAVMRRAGGAVARNRIRRRLRAALRDLAGRGGLPAGDYLVSASGETAHRPWDQLVASVDEAVAAATEPRR